MKKLGGFLLGGIGMFSVPFVHSQGIVETALLFSRTNNEGSARMQGMGGAQVSLGGDFSSASSNPAGLGMFNRSEFTISPSYSNSNVEASYFGNKVNQARANLSIPSLSFAFHSEKNQGSWISGTFAITLTRLNNFNSTINYKGVNEHHSLMDFIAIDSDGIQKQDLLPKGEYYNTLNGLAYNNYLIEPNSNNLYFSAVGINYNDPTGKDVPSMTQQEEIITSGGQNQWSASYGVNIEDRFFFGAGLQLRSLRFDSKKTYGESDFHFVAFPSYNPLHNFSLEETLKISGTGYAGILGAIIRPFDGLQIGVSFTSPTTYTLSDVYSARLKSDWNKFDYWGDGSEILDKMDFETAEILSDYNLKTPGRITGGATYFFGKSGFISADLESVNYSAAKYVSKTNGFSVDSDNGIIKGLYRATFNFRMGGEYRVENFRFRAGFGILGEPFQEKQNNISRTISNYSLGCGYKTKGFYIDAALSLKAGKNSYRPYNMPGDFSPLVTMNNQTAGILFTIGVPF